MVKIKYVPWIPINFAGMAPFPCRIYIHKRMMERPAADRERLINHERVHIEQMWREGYWQWLFKYAFNGRWRAVYEFEAYSSNIMSFVGAGVVSSALADFYIDKVLTRLTFWGAMYITSVVLLPEIFRMFNPSVPLNFGGTSLLILVVVTMDFMSQMQAHAMSHQYEGMMQKANLRNYGRGGQVR